MLPQDLQLKFKHWIASIESIKNLHIPRCYFPGQSLSSIPQLEIHAFSDASEKGYGTCISFRVSLCNNEFHATFVMS